MYYFLFFFPCGKCSVTGDVPAGDVLETYDTVGWLLGPDCGHGEFPVSLGRGTVPPSFLIRQLGRFQYVASSDRLRHLFCGDHRGLALHSTETRGGTERAGL